MKKVLKDVGKYECNLTPVPMDPYVTFVGNSVQIHLLFW